MKEDVKKVVVDGLEVSIDYKETGRGREIGLFVKYPEFLTKDFYVKNHKLIDEVFWYTAYKFHLEQLTNALNLMERLKSLDLFDVFDWSDELFVREGKTALIDVFVYKGCVKAWDVRPAVKIDCGRFEAFTIMPGNFADFSVFLSHNGGLLGTTKDFNLPGAILTTVFLIDVMENVKKYVVNGELFDIDKNYQYHQWELLRPVQEDLLQTINQLVSKNKSKRIDLLKVDNESILEKVRKHNLSKYFISSQTVFNMAILYGKPFKQVEDYLKKVV